MENKTQSQRYRMHELLSICPLPVDFDKDTFKVQIKSDDGKSTKWLSITGEEFNLIESILINGK